MVKISTTKGLNLPFKERLESKSIDEKKSQTVSIDLSRFMYLHLKVTKEAGETIEEGEVLAIDTHNPSRVYRSFVSGKILEIQRGPRRRLKSIIIEISPTTKSFKPLSLDLSKEKIMEEIFSRGLSFSIHKRPFHRVIDPTSYPRSIFVNTITSAPLTPSFKYILKGNEELFQTGLTILSKIAPVHTPSNEKVFSGFKDCSHHSVYGKHPIESPSLHILGIDPIKSASDVVWSLDVADVLNIGSMWLKGRFFNETIVFLSGKSLLRTNKGAHIPSIIDEKTPFISGNPLTGQVDQNYLREKDRVITFLPETAKREILSFAKPGFFKPTMTKTYIGGFFRNKIGKRNYTLGGEKRPFILKDIYEKYFPFNIYIEPLIKALMAKDFEQALSLGFLDLDTEDFAILEYICPSKISLMELFEKGKNDYLALQ